MKQTRLVDITFLKLNHFDTNTCKLQSLAKDPEQARCQFTHLDIAKCGASRL